MKFSEIKQFFSSNKSIRQTIFKNTFWLGISQVISRGLKFLLVIYIARILGDTDYGKFNFALSLVVFLGLFANLGIGRVANREFSKDRSKEKEYIPSLISLKIFLSFLIIVVIAIIASVFIDDAVTRNAVFVLIIYAALQQFAEFFHELFRSHQKMEYEAISVTLNTIFCVSFGLFFLFNIPSVVTLSWAYVIGVAASFFFAFILYQKKYDNLGFVINKDTWKQMLSIAWPIGFMGIFTTLFHKVDSVMLGMWGMMEENGWYGAAYRIMEVCLIPAVLTSKTFFPIFSKAFRGSIEFKPNTSSKAEGSERYSAKRKIFLSQLSILTIIVVPLLVGGIFLASPIIKFVFGAQFTNAVLAFQILMGTTLVMYLQRGLGQPLIAANYQKLMFRLTFIAAVLNIVLNFILIPQYSLYGAAVATLATFSLMFVGYLILTKKKLSLSPFDKYYGKVWLGVIISSLLMSVVINLSLIKSFHVVLVILIGALVYSISMLLFDKFLKLDLIKRQ